MICRLVCIQKQLQGVHKVGLHFQKTQFLAKNIKNVIEILHLICLLLDYSCSAKNLPKRGLSKMQADDLFQKQIWTHLSMFGVSRLEKRWKRTLTPRRSLHRTSYSYS